MNGFIALYIYKYTAKRRKVLSLSKYIDRRTIHHISSLLEKHMRYILAFSICFTLRDVSRLRACGTWSLFLRICVECVEFMFLSYLFIFRRTALFALVYTIEFRVMLFSCKNKWGLWFCVRTKNERKIKERYTCSYVIIIR